MLLFASDYSAGYTIGQVTAIVVLTVLAVWLGRRLLRDRRAAPHSLAPAAASPAAPASVAPPGWEKPEAPLPAPPAPAPRAGRTRSARVTDAIALAVVAVLLTGALVNLLGGRDEVTWDSPEGREMRAGFIAGCSYATPGPICECVFETVTASAPYDTPAGFITLAGPVNAALRARDPQAMPPALIAAMRACAAGRQTA